MPIQRIDSGSRPAAPSTITAAALDASERGWSVIPLRPRDKRPLLAWEEYQRRRAGADEIRGWFARWPDANLGVVTGSTSGVVVLDVDAGHGGSESIARLESEHEPLPPTIAVVTGGGGRHVYFAPGGAALHNRAGIAPGLDFRGEGGYVVVPPSIHPSGNRYVWAPGAGPRDVPLALIPGWLKDLVGDAEQRRGHPLIHWQTLVREGVDQGLRNSTLASIAGHLLWHGVDPLVVLDLLLSWNARRCRPPLSDDEVARTVQSITRTHFRHHRGTVP